MTSCKTLSMALLSFMALFSTAAGAEDNQPPAGFTSLFNGKDMTGWITGPGGHWKADGGAIVYDGKLNHLVSEKAFSDFILLIDWKIEKDGNSGILLRGEPQVEIWDSQSMGSGRPVEPF